MKFVSLLVVLFSMFSQKDLAAETVLRRVQLFEGNPRSQVVGLETQDGVIVGVGSLDKSKSGLKSSVRLEQIQDRNQVFLRDGKKLDLRAVDYVYVQEQLQRVSAEAGNGKHPNIDDNTSGN